MLITIRAYRHSDLDLMLLGDAFGNKYSAFIRECLRCYIRGVPLRVGLPDIAFVPSEELTAQSKSTGVMLKEDEDADIIAVMKNIRYGYRNNFTKNVIRMFTATQCIAAYAATGQCYDFLNEMQQTPTQQVLVRPKTILSLENAPAPRVSPKKVASSKPVQTVAVQEESAPQVSALESSATPATTPTAVIPDTPTESAPVTTEETNAPIVPDTASTSDTAEGGLSEGDLSVFNDFLNLIG